MSDAAYLDPPARGEAQREADPGSLPRRIVDTYFSPIALFSRFGARPPWVGVLVISAVLTGLLMLLMPRDLIVAQIQDAMRSRPQPAGAPAPDMDTMVMFGRVGGVISQVVAQPVAALLAAGLCTLVFGMLMDGGGTFRRHLAVASHAALVTPLGFAITLFFMAQSGDPTTQLSLALLVPGLETESFAFRVLNALGVFTLWWLALIGVGAAAVNRRVSPFKGTAVVLGIYLAVVVAIAAVRG
jgi:hypothetical protein